MPGIKFLLRELTAVAKVLESDCQCQTIQYSPFILGIKSILYSPGPFVSHTDMLVFVEDIVLMRVVVRQEIFLLMVHVTVDELDRCLCPLGVQSEFARVVCL